MQCTCRHTICLRQACPTLPTGMPLMQVSNFEAGGRTGCGSDLRTSSKKHLRIQHGVSLPSTSLAIDVDAPQNVKVLLGRWSNLKEKCLHYPALIVVLKLAEPCTSTTSGSRMHVWPFTQLTDCNVFHPLNHSANPPASVAHHISGAPRPVVPCQTARAHLGIAWSLFVN